MGSRIVFCNREVTNPVAKALICILAIVIVALVLGLVMFVVLPLVGVTIAFSVGLAILIPIAVILAIPLLMAGGTVLGLILAPFVALVKAIRRRS
ncbi:MAG: hypothetical protein WBH35_10415 [Bacillota bacterium]|jgi:hypothetical protein|nr:hypothetical protein [Bacillota bacterium]HOB91990.1 hypothetical protein [Bacillota bacterium]HPZ55263.1 hypothetical protein [Bacillota bacterium]HQD18211.1 hypothetical protein [Bacillota bacterium]